MILLFKILFYFTFTRLARLYIHNFKTSFHITFLWYFALYISSHLITHAPYASHASPQAPHKAQHPKTC
jgi:hypothetical protein